MLRKYALHAGKKTVLKVQLALGNRNANSSSA